jgi:sugar phosphate permease
MRAWRIRIFIATWLCYAGLYFCRHAFYVAKPELTLQRGLDSATLGWIGVVYLVFSALGEFNAAAVGTRIGARRTLLAGMALSILANLGFGLAHSATCFGLLLALNGLAQATGWSCNVGTMAHWFRRTERGQVMGLWSTCYQLGAVAAKMFAGFNLGRGGLRQAFWAAAGVLAAVWATFFVLHRNRPEEVGLRSLEPVDPGATSGAAAPLSQEGTRGWDRELVTTVALMGCFYFFVKSIRYALWSWAPYFLKLNFGLASDRAGHLAAVFDFCGFLGVITAGVISDRLFAGRRAGVALVMIAGLAGSTLLLWLVGARSLTLFGLCIGLIGFTLYGPDSLISGAGAIDVGSRRHALAAAGIINGMGSVGPVLQEALIGSLYKRDPANLTRILGLLTSAAMLACLVMGLLVRRARAGKCNL